MSTPEAGDLVEIRLLGIPVDLQQKASEHNDGLRREFQLLVQEGKADAMSVPARLVKLATELDRRFQAFTESTRGEIEQARLRGDKQVDVTLRLPREAAPAAQEMGNLMREADRYCAAGKHLLTLAAPPDVVSFRDWVVDEVVRQVEGGAPTPWSQTPQAAS